MSALVAVVFWPWVFHYALPAAVDYLKELIF